MRAEQERYVAREAELEQKLDRLRRALREAGVGTLALYHGGQHNASRMDPVFWLTDYRSLGPVMMVIPAEDEATLLVTQPWETTRARETGTQARIVASSRGNLAADAAALMKKLPQPFALSGRAAMPIAVFEAFQAAAGALLGAGDEIIPPLAARRLPSELARVERAAKIADDGFTALCALARPGMREYELAAELDAAMYGAGAEDNFGLIGAGNLTTNVTIRPPTARKLEPGDVIIAEITPCYQGYLAQLCRTVVLGEISETQRKTYALLAEAERAGLAAAVPGNETAAIAKAINAVISAAGYAEYCKPPYMRSRGHGLGNGGVAPTDINESSKRPLERDMTMVIHPNQFVPETGYLMCGDMVVIEEGGPRVLSSTPLRLFQA